MGVGGVRHALHKKARQWRGLSSGPSDYSSAAFKVSSTLAISGKTLPEIADKAGSTLRAYFDLRL